MCCCKCCQQKQSQKKGAGIEDVFQPIPMAIFKGYKKVGTLYPKGWKYNGTILEQDVFMKTEG